MFLGIHVDDGSEFFQSPSSTGDSDVSLELIDTASSTGSNSSSSTSQFPTKKGLSKYYHGKSESFMCLFDVRCVEDLAKKHISHKTGMNESKKFYASDQCSNNILRRDSRVSSCA